MRIGKRRILINPNVQKFACAAMLLTGWFWWPRESQYKEYAARVKEESNT